MPLVDMRGMLNHAYRNDYAVGAIDLVSLDFLEAITLAAEHRRSPVKVIDSYHNHPDYAAFTNQLFHPVAHDRISIAFAAVKRATEQG